MNDLTLHETMPIVDTVDTGLARESDLLGYWRAISRRRWAIVGLAIIAGLLATLVVNGMQPLYRSTATLLVEQTKKVVSIEQVLAPDYGQRDYYQTQIEILKSDDIARKVVKKLNLVTHPAFDPRQAEQGWLARIASRWVAPAETAAPVSDEAVMQAVIDRFRAGLAAQMVRNSQLTQITFTSIDRDLAARVPNAVAETYIESDLESRVARTQKAAEWLRDRMGELRTKLETSEKALQEFRDRERILDSKGIVISGASRQLDDLTRSVIEARQKRADVENGYAMVQQVKSGKASFGYDAIPAVLRNPLVQRVKEQQADAERRLAEAAKRYGPEHPRMIQAKSEFESVRENYRQQVELAVATLIRDYESAKLNESAAEKALTQSKADIQSLNRKEFQLGVLERDVQQNRNLYDMFVNRLKETNATGGLEPTIARVVDAANVPNGPFSPNRSRIISIAVLATVIVAAFLAILLDRLSNTLNSTADVETRLGVPALGVLQKIATARKKGFVSELAFFNDTQSTFAEAVRSVRTSVLMSALDDAHKIVVITSSVPEEGKTTLSFNLACALGQVKKVLLIDGDLRRPKIARLVRREPSLPGLADLVAGQAQVSQCVFFDNRSGIHILPAGTVPPNPLELLSSRRFDDVITKLKEAFDIVIVDSAPLQLVSDAQVLSQFASAVIYVVKADSTPYQVALNGLKKLRRANARLLGVVLNQLDLEKAEKYYGEYSGYKTYRGYKGRAYTRTYGAE